MPETKRSRTAKGVSFPTASNIISITSRENEFSESTWWMVDITTNIKQGATPLVKRCMRVYNWDETKTRKVLNAYRQFLFLKKHYEDWDDKLLSASRLVEQMWQQHLLDVANYCHDMMLLCGHVVGYNPDKNEENEREKSAREGGTHQSLEQHFKGSYDKEVWGVNDAKCENDNESEDLEEITDFVVVEGSKKSHRGDEVLVEIYRSSDNITTYRVKKSNHLAACLIHFANIYRRRVGEFEFIYNGNSINGLSSPNSIQSLGFVPEQGKPLRIIALLRPENAVGDHSGIISIRVRDISGEETFFRIKLDTQMDKYSKLILFGKECHVRTLYFFSMEYGLMASLLLGCLSWKMVMKYTPLLNRQAVKVRRHKDNQQCLHLEIYC
jgi:hypothetical protein